MAYPTDQSAGRELLTLLIEKASEQGYLTIEDILEVNLRQAEEAEFPTDKVVAYLLRQGIDIIDAGENDLTPVKLQIDIVEDDGRAPAQDAFTSQDSVEIYLREMSLVPLLSVEEELSIAKRIVRGRIAKEELFRMNGNGSAKVRKELRDAVQDGLLAREHIIKANTRLVVSIAKKYMGRGVPFLDLIQEGNLGLMKAVEKFDHCRGFRFSTYATWWIRQTITRCIADQGRTIRLPVHMSDRIRQLYRAFHALEQIHGRPPTVGELADRLKVTTGKVEWMLQVSWIPLSLESPVGDEDDSELGMFVEDHATPTPVQVVNQHILRDLVEEVLSTLSPREARVLRLRFGLDEGRPYTLEEVGAKFGLTRERIRQIEGKALRRLRHPYCSKRLRDYL